jgi:hypothetical protein
MSRLEGGLAAVVIAIFGATVLLGMAYLVAIIWAIIKVTNHFAP